MHLIHFCRGWDQTGSNGASKSFNDTSRLLSLISFIIHKILNSQPNSVFPLMRAHRMLHTIAGSSVLSMPLLTWLQLSGASRTPRNFAPHISIYILFSGCWLSDPLNNYFGRRGTIFISALILIATPIASGFTHSWQILFVVRLILGIGMGVKGEQYLVTNTSSHYRIISHLLQALLYLCTPQKIPQQKSGVPL